MHADRVQNKTHKTSHTSGWEPRYFVVFINFHLLQFKVDFTSGVSEVFDLTKSGYQTDDPEKKRELFNIMCSEIEDHALMCCAIQVRTE